MLQRYWRRHVGVALRSICRRRVGSLAHVRPWSRRHGWRLLSRLLRGTVLLLHLRHDAHLIIVVSLLHLVLLRHHVLLRFSALVLHGQVVRLLLEDQLLVLILLLQAHLLLGVLLAQRKLLLLRLLVDLTHQLPLLGLRCLEDVVGLLLLLQPEHLLAMLGLLFQALAVGVLLRRNRIRIRHPLRELGRLARDALLRRHRVGRRNVGATLRDFLRQRRRIHGRWRHVCAHGSTVLHRSLRHDGVRALQGPAGCRRVGATNC
mmetsp:Transcript_11157/g.32959  ORF Transcript_11157/g.32959 Transcript_11157/m.32959 type:complete len:261 (+) Transcript_11157:648-1430(+)